MITNTLKYSNTCIFTYQSIQEGSLNIFYMTWWIIFKLCTLLLPLSLSIAGITMFNFWRTAAIWPGHHRRNGIHISWCSVKTVKEISYVEILKHLNSTYSANKHFESSGQHWSEWKEWNPHQLMLCENSKRNKLRWNIEIS